MTGQAGVNLRQVAYRKDMQVSLLLLPPPVCCPGGHSKDSAALCAQQSVNLRAKRRTVGTGEKDKYFIGCAQAAAGISRLFSGGAGLSLQHLPERAE